MIYPLNGGEVVGPTFARQLERELAAEKARADHYRTDWHEGAKMWLEAEHAKLIDERDALRRQCETMREALEVLFVPFNKSVSSHNGGLPSGVYVQRFRFENAAKALSSVPPAKQPEAEDTAKGESKLSTGEREDYRDALEELERLREINRNLLARKSTS